MSEYEARKIKQAVVGTGAATKKQVQLMVKSLLALSELPKEDAATVWGKIIYNMERVRKVAETVEYFDEDNELVRTISFHDVKELDGRHIPMRMIVTPEDEPNESTLISYQELTFDKPLPKGLFSVRNLKRK